MMYTETKLFTLDRGDVFRFKTGAKRWNVCMGVNAALKTASYRPRKGGKWRTTTENHTVVKANWK